MNRGMQKTLSERGITKVCGGNAIWNKYVLSFFQRVVIVSDVFKVMGSSFQTLGTTTEKAHLPSLSLVLGTVSLVVV